MCARRGLDWQPGALSSQLNISLFWTDHSALRELINRLPAAGAEGEFNWDSARLSTPGSRPPISADDSAGRRTHRLRRARRGNPSDRTCRRTAALGKASEPLAGRKCAQIAPQPAASPW